MADDVSTTAVGSDGSTPTIGSLISGAGLGAGLVTALQGGAASNATLNSAANLNLALGQAGLQDLGAGNAGELPILNQMSGQTQYPDLYNEMVDPIMGTIQGQYDTQAQNTERQMEDLGGNPASGNVQSAIAQQRGGEASAVSSALDNARLTARQAQLSNTWSQEGDVANLYAALAGRGTTALQGGAQGQQQVAGTQANNAANAANALPQLANSASSIINQSGVLTGPSGDVAATGIGNMNSAALDGTAAGADAATTIPGGFAAGDSVAAGAADDGLSGLFDFGIDALLKDGGVVRRTAIPIRNRLHLADGGKITGPGTGTSDSVSAIKAPGTYILSADTVHAVGTKKLHDLMHKAGVRPGENTEPPATGVPVRLSKGEWDMPPDVVKYYGHDFFDKMQQRYHHPVAADAGNEHANGGVVKAIRPRILPRAVEHAIYNHMPTRAIGGRRR